MWDNALASGGWPAAPKRRSFLVAARSMPPSIDERRDERGTDPRLPITIGSKPARARISAADAVQWAEAEIDEGDAQQNAKRAPSWPFHEFEEGIHLVSSVMERVDQPRDASELQPRCRLEFIWASTS